MIEVSIAKFGGGERFDTPFVVLEIVDKVRVDDVGCAVDQLASGGKGR